MPIWKPARTVKRKCPHCGHTWKVKVPAMGDCLTPREAQILSEAGGNTPCPKCGKNETEENN